MNRQGGFSLLEVLLSLLILSMVTLGYLAVQGRAVVASANADKRHHATLLAHQHAQMTDVMQGFQKEIYQQQLSQLYHLAITQDNPILAYQKALDGGVNLCTLACQEAQMARHQAFLLAQSASDVGMMIMPSMCQGQACLVAIWGDMLSQDTSCDESGQQQCVAWEFE
ncbi:prepilin-type N-terminal cleavage/methylation domain-containing protein [Moraxella nasicaprae]|uniref:Prepilin-type N-terminal cleavage/methylation domain-containing protein n=1 Tax=Moraxella nasicaprae TaxID=2904122 RepID=A0ABY6F5N1_9GAMM|nr:prepilin-type N-terminal cleavage/methylation domain-containing protein [Moraxella nasicaprae]UXZ05400.1 prepilin-type N-terminal cleavage/methylation domain-containing protein [Moraxella nasicaprae]